MAKPTTTQALRKLLTTEDLLLLWIESGYSRADRRRYLHRLNQGELSRQKMEEILLQCGYSVAAETRWNRP
jgi:hypothetical protein